MYEKLLKIVTNLGRPKVLVVGDFMLDTYIYGDALTNGELSAQLGKKPFVKTREAADALIPYIRRMPFDKKRSGS